jgi:preprotein translocase subunit SecG
MENALMILQVVISILLALVILLQNRGTGLGSLAGGGGGGFHAERRGAELLLHRVTILLAVLFCANAFVIGFLPSV